MTLIVVAALGCNLGPRGGAIAGPADCGVQPGDAGGEFRSDSERTPHHVPQLARTQVRTASQLVNRHPPAAFGKEHQRFERISRDSVGFGSVHLFEKAGAYQPRSLFGWAACQLRADLPHPRQQVVNIDAAGIHLPEWHPGEPLHGRKGQFHIHRRLVRPKSQDGRGDPGPHQSGSDRLRSVRLPVVVNVDGSTQADHQPSGQGRHGSMQPGRPDVFAGGDHTDARLATRVKQRHRRILTSPGVGSVIDSAGRQD